MTSSATPQNPADDSAQRLPVRCLDARKGVQMLGTESVLRKILKTVADGLANDIPGIKQWMQEGNLPAVRSALHAMKGFVPLIGTDVLVERVLQAEALDPTQAPDEATRNYLALLPLLECLHTETLAHLAAA
jgi:hypothetical protein